jgi:ABC-2 type transport system permease protein
MVVLHHGPDWSYLPVLLLALVTGIVLASALGVLLSSINVYLRDTQHLIEVILTAWFWACPIVYAYQANIGDRLGPRSLTWIYFLNPVVPLVLTFQRCIYADITVTAHGAPYAVLPPKGMLWYVGLDLGVLALSVVLFLVALAVFGRLEGNFAEEL